MGKAQLPARKWRQRQSGGHHQNHLPAAEVILQVPVHAPILSSGPPVIAQSMPIGRVQRYPTGRCHGSRRAAIKKIAAGHGYFLRPCMPCGRCGQVLASLYIQVGSQNGRFWHWPHLFVRPAQQVPPAARLKRRPFFEGERSLVSRRYARGDHGSFQAECTVAAHRVEKRPLPCKTGGQKTGSGHSLPQGRWRTGRFDAPFV